MEKKISQQDIEILSEIRSNVNSLIAEAQLQYDKTNMYVLEIAPQIYEGAKKVFERAVIQTLDIDAQYTPTYIADICENNSHLIPDNYFDAIICTEVLEHTLQPFNAVAELHRILKHGGKLFGSTPFNFRIHGPLPDCWRFTEHGLRALFKDYSNFLIKELEDPNRFLMPFHYTFIATK